MDGVDLTVHGLRLLRGPRGLAPASADKIVGTVALTLDDLTAALARPGALEPLLNNIPGIARPEIRFDNDANGGVRIKGSVEAFGRRIPIAASTRVRVVNNRLVVTATHVE